LNQTPVMSVISPRRSYWRGETRSQYTGEGWAISEVEREAALSSVSVKLPLAQDPELAYPRLKTVEVTQTVTMAELGKEYPVLFGAYAIDKVRSIVTDGAGNNFAPLQWSPRLSELRWTKDNQRIYPISYTLTSKVPVVEEEELRKLPAVLTSTAGLDEYLILPESLPSRVRELALQVTAPGLNMYDKVKRLEQYLANTYPYTTTPDLSKGQSKDFVDRFLFEMKEGYCDYFSTAMAVMLRSIGVPSRWVKGFAPGEATADGEYLVRNSDAHSWVEVYFPGYGWLPFEPTSGFSLPANGMEAGSAAEQLPEATPSPEVSSEPEPIATAEPVAAVPLSESRLGFIGWGAGAFVAVIFLGLGFVWMFRRRIGFLQRIWPTDGQRSTSRRALLEVERFLRDARRRGYSRKEHETVREALQRWSGAAANDIEALLLLFEKAKYSDLPVTEEELEELTSKVQEIRNRWKNGDGKKNS
jgi:transglutaminase-like putative cysteine protease